MPLQFLLALAVTLAPALSDPPAVEPAIVAGFPGYPLAITGHGFGENTPDGRIILQFGNADPVRIDRADPRIESWRDDRIIFRLPDDAACGVVTVAPDARKSPAHARLDVFRYDWFDIPRTPGTNACPLAVTVDSKSRVWINEEFHLAFQQFDPERGAVQSISIPRPPDPGPFATTIFGDHRTQTSMCGEDVIIDPRGRVWFTQGGGYLYSGPHPNHSRIICYDPDESDRFCIYNVPEDHNEVIGLAWDAKRNVMWFANGGLDYGARLMCFDPEATPHDEAFDFSQSLDHLLRTDGPPAAPDEKSRGTYRVYKLPNPKSQPAHLLVDPDGFVWYTNFWGNSIGRLDPNSGDAVEIPLPKAIGTSEPTKIVGSGPWQLVLSPDRKYILFNEFFDDTLCRIRRADAARPESRSLDEAGRNPCIEELVVPGADLANEQVHSIALDREGRMWFTIHGPKDPPSEEYEFRASLGFVTADFKHIVRLPSLAPFDAPASPAGAGIAIDHRTGDLWFAEFWRQRVGRIKRVISEQE